MADDWTELYRPQGLQDVVGNPKMIKELRDWALSWEEGQPSYGAVVLMGPPGVGKTSAALALARDFSWGVVEMNASDHRNAEAIKRIATRGSQSETFTDEGEFLSSKDGRLKLIILDEADNIFGREDYGGVPAITELITKTRQPVILIVNDFYELSRRSSAIKANTLQIRVGKVQPATMRSVLKKIALDQGIDLPDRVLETVIENSGGDMRAAVRDLQAVCEGNTNIGDDDAFVLQSRMSIRSMYDLMRDVLQGTDPKRARTTMMSVEEPPDYVRDWLDENIPLQYKDPKDMLEAYKHLSKADIFLARVMRRQYYGLWSYASDMMSYGVTTAKRKAYRGYVQYKFPSYIMKMSRSKGVRATKSQLSQKVGAYTHTSIRTARQDVVPYLMVLFQKDRDFRLAMIDRLDISQEEVAFLLQKKVDSSEVRHTMDDLQKLRSARKDNLVPVERIIEEKVSDKPIKKIEPKGKQASLFEY